MKKLTLLALAVLLIPGLALADGDPGLYVDFGADALDVIPGETVVFTLGPANFGFTTPACPDTDTFCVALLETAGWFDSAEPPLGECQILDPGYLWWQDITIYVPCDVNICDYDTLIFGMYYCDDTLGCRPDIPDCLDPTDWDGDPIYQHDTIILHVVEAPPALYILQDSIYLVSQGQTNAYVPFALCNGDPCAAPTPTNYLITSKGHIPGNPAFPQGGVQVVNGGECENVYAVVNAGAANICDLDTLTIIAWVGTTYDTCVQLIHVVEAVEVPLFTAPVVTILVLAMILAAAVIMRKRAVSRA
jgi:hypothetical protein